MTVHALQGSHHHRFFRRRNEKLAAADLARDPARDEALRQRDVLASLPQTLDVKLHRFF